MQLKIEIPFDIAILSGGIFPKELELSYYMDTCIPMSIAALFITVKLWNMCMCPPTYD